MAVSVKNVSTPKPPGAERRVVCEVTFDSSYQSEGEPLTAEQLGLKFVKWANCLIINGSEEATVRPTNAYYTPATGKIHLIDSATGKEVASTKNMEKVVVQVEAFGF